MSTDFMEKIIFSGILTAVLCVILNIFFLYSMCYFWLLFLNSSIENWIENTSQTDIRRHLINLLLCLLPPNMQVPFKHSDCMQSNQFSWKLNSNKRAVIFFSLVRCPLTQLCTNSILAPLAVSWCKEPSGRVQNVEQPWLERAQFYELFDGFAIM